MSARARAAVFARIALALAACVFVLTAARAAGAHALGLSRGEYTLEGSHVTAVLTLRADEVALAVPGLDADGDGRVTARDLASAGSAIEATFVDGLSVEADHARCVGRLDGAALDPPDGVRIRATYDCPRSPARLRLSFGFLQRMPSGHRHLATVHLARGDVDTLAVLARPDVEVDVGSGGSRGLVSLLRAGIEHILSGADHLAFLLALVLGATLAPTGKRTRAAALVAMLSAFTVGHSASLAVATLGGFAPGPRWVEPAVALSVAYVGAENLFVRSVRHRWMVTLPFGFVHGFAFAGGIIPLGLPRAQLPLALLAFNLGVEVGQLLVLGFLLALVAAVGSARWYPRVARAISLSILAIGVAWFIQRVA